MEERLECYDAFLGYVDSHDDGRILSPCQWTRIEGEVRGKTTENGEHDAFA
jgi:hypothetical protein